MNEVVLEIVREYVPGAFSVDAPFADLSIDSLEFIQIVKDVEGVLNVTIPNEALSHIVTVRDLIAEIEAVRPSS